jgi:hypothetical protein
MAMVKVPFAAYFTLGRFDDAPQADAKRLAVTKKAK